MPHSIIPPSSAGVWGKPGGCTGWVTMAQTYRETETSLAAKEGTASRGIAELMNRANSRARLDYPEKEKVVGGVASNGVVFTNEMYDAAEVFADDVASVMRETGVFSGRHIGVERSISAPRVHELSRETSNAFIYSENRGRLYIWGYKYGFNPVDAYENWQAINCLAGIFDEFDINEEDTVVHVRIVQPRAFHPDGPVREWAVAARDLGGYFEVLRENAHKALGPDAEYKSGDHCKYCPGRHACPAALKAGLGLYEAASQPVPVELDADALSVQYAIVQRARRQLEYLETGYEERIKGLAQRGESIRGFRVEERLGRERWSEPVETIAALGDMLGHNLRKNTAITPNQARKLGIDAAVITAYSEIPRTGFKVVPDDGSKAKQIFSKLNKGAMI